MATLMLINHRKTFMRAAMFNIAFWELISNYNKHKYSSAI